MSLQDHQLRINPVLAESTYIDNFLNITLCVQFQLTLSARRKLEVDLQTLLQEHEELQGALRGSMDKSKKASSEVKHTQTFER